MVKLPQSSRPDRRKPSKTDRHPLQRNIFAPTLVSSMSDVGTGARIIAGLFVPLIIAYLTTSNALPDESAIKRIYYRDAFYLTAAFAVFAAVEVMRTARMLDTEKFGRFPKFAIIAFAFASAVSLCVGIANLVNLHDQGYEQRRQEQQRRELERQRKDAKEQMRKEAEAECNALKAKDIEALTKRKNSAAAEQKKCVTEWVSPGIFSKETAESHCAPKASASNRSSQELKDKQALECAGAAKTRYP